MIETEQRRIDRKRTEDDLYRASLWTGIVWCKIYVSQTATRQDRQAESKAIARAVTWLPDTDCVDSDAGTVDVTIAITTRVYIDEACKCQSGRDAAAKAHQILDDRNRQANKQNPDIPRIIDVETIRIDPD